MTGYMSGNMAEGLAVGNYQCRLYAQSHKILQLGFPYHDRDTMVIQCVPDGPVLWQNQSPFRCFTVDGGDEQYQRFWPYQVAD